MSIKITVLGNFSGRNAGDNAILGNLVRDITREIPEAEFLVPTLSKNAVRNICRGFNVRPMGLMPWHGALKIFGLATLRAMLRTDCVLITDNILFDKKLFNPVFNYLSTIALLAPLSRRRGIPVILYNASVGPVTTVAGANALRRVLKDSPIAVLRDRASIDLIARIVDPPPRMILAADCALGTEVPAMDTLTALARQLGVTNDGRARLGLNVNVYVDAWKVAGRSVDSSSFVTQIASVFDTLT
jgi:polysaccharide pyruvyl transferase WcaK-like protein